MALKAIIRYKKIKIKYLLLFSINWHNLVLKTKNNIFILDFY